MRKEVDLSEFPVGDWEFSPSEIGKTVFLTQSEAEQSLKEQRNDN